MKIMKQCKSCSKEFPFNAKCCPECGAINLIEKADKVNIMKQCKKCSKDFSINNHFCPGCGAMNPISKMAAGLGVVLLILGFILVVGTAGGSDSGNVEPVQEISQSISENTIAENELEDNVPLEYESALKNAKAYSDTLCMSKAMIYDQLIHDSEVPYYGEEKFSAEAAQYAVDNVEVDWKENALKTAQAYSYTLNMSKAAIYDQLISEVDQFTPEEAQYAIDNLE